jgi:hypothetical protein
MVKGRELYRAASTTTARPAQAGASWTESVGLEVRSADSVSLKLLLYLRLLYEDPIGPGAGYAAIWVTTRNTKS